MDLSNGFVNDRLELVPVPPSVALMLAFAIGTPVGISPCRV
jgi:hypothetical protein